MRSSATKRRPRRDARQGAVAVEFAFVAPVLVTLVLGVIEVNRMYDTQTLLETAAREGARFASMDRDGLVPEGTTTNDKMVSDMKTFLETNGMDNGDVNIEVVHAEDPSTPFDLDNPENDLKLFEVRVSVDYSDVSLTSIDAGSDFTLTGKVTFRNGVATLSN
ncbi:MAG: TadE family protein [Planctomycetota bacterium]